MNQIIQKDKVLEMILSHDVEVRYLGITLAISDPGWILSLVINYNKTVTTIDFCESCMNINHNRKKKKYFFTYKDEYYLLEEAGVYISCYCLKHISKEEYESNKT